MSNISCNQCGQYLPDQNSHLVGVYDDIQVCSSCFKNCVLAIGKYRRCYYIPIEDAIQVYGEYYDRRHLQENDIIEIDLGYVHKMDAIKPEGSEYWKMLGTRYGIQENFERKNF